MNDTKVLILCGGRGKRMGVLTKEIPKPLISLGNKSILEYKLKRYQSQGVKHFIFCIGYRGNIIRHRVEKVGVKAEFSDIGERAGMLERIHAVRSIMSSPTIISYGDTYAEINLKKLIAEHNKSGALLTLVAAPIKNPFGLLEWDHNKRIHSFKEKPVLNHYIGYIVIEPETFEEIPEKILKLPDGQGLIKAIQIMSALGEVNAYIFTGLQLTVNTKQELKFARREIGKYFTTQEDYER